MKYIYKPILILFFLVIGSQISNAQNSVLAQGYWYKLGIQENAIYHLTYQDFVQMGFDVENLDPAKIQVYGNFEGQLPEPNNIVIPNELIQNTIYVQGSEDGSFDEGDYIAFYAEGAHEYIYEGSSSQFRYEQHAYDSKNFYFITVGEEDGLRIPKWTTTNETPLKTITTFPDYYVHEEDIFNFVKSGREWFGESFEDYEEMVFEANFPNLVTEEEVRFGVYAAGFSRVSSEILVQPEGAEAQELYIPYVVGNYTQAKEGELIGSYNSASDNVKLSLSYNPPVSTDNAWLNYLEITAVRELKMHEHQMRFNYNALFNANEVFRFKLSNANDQLNIWDVTDPYEVKELIGYELNNDTLEFGLRITGTQYFIAFNTEGLKSPEFVGQVENQDLKGLEPFDYLIITSDEFFEEANRLADFHKTNSQLRCEVVLVDKIYNEFSSGKQDPTAIRNFVKYHYNNNEEEDQPKYLLLFGDASYDYKDLIPNNTNIVPVFQSKGSTALTATYNTDDYFGIMGQLDGDSSFGEINISIGRFPVNTLEEAKIMVDKTIGYASNLQDRMGDWRNNICFIADDEDSNLHFKDSNTLADTFMFAHPEFNVNKIFLDSYVQTTTANGKRYPDVTDAINYNVDKGTMFFNYTGHGGHLALTDERVLQISDIVNWDNAEKLGVWIVASCEFGPFDNPDHTSAGEHLVLNPNGGGVALFTTTRLAYASYNFQLNEKFHEIAFSRKEDGSHYRLGDIIRYAKNESGNKEKNLNFVLLGDPALKMAYPEYHVETTHINGMEVENFAQDTIKGRQTIDIKGKVTGLDHSTLTDFNGLVYFKVFGKPSTYHTLANDPKSYVADFDIIDQVVQEGVAKANDGMFEFTFVVPSNISSAFGAGKISYYALEDLESEMCIDANGGFNDFIIGGVDESIQEDLQGPEIKVYLESYNFESGMSTSTTPMLMVDLFDENGINTVNLGFGKEIKATVDGYDYYYLNDYYEAVDYSYKNGKIEYKLDELSYGNHTLKVKAWDNFDNASEKSVDFIVVSEEQINVNNLLNNPNPVFDQTSFVFQHNQLDENVLDVEIKLYSFSGQLVWIYQTSAIVLGNTIEPIQMDVSNPRLSLVQSGVYSYTVEVSNSEGQSIKAQQKMLIVK